MNEIKELYNSYYSDESVKERQWEKDNELNLIFERFFMSAAKHAAMRGQRDIDVMQLLITDAHGNHLDVERNKVWCNLDFFVKTCADLGFTTSIGDKHQCFRQFIISGWATEQPKNNSACCELQKIPDEF